MTDDPVKSAMEAMFNFFKRCYQKGEHPEMQLWAVKDQHVFDFPAGNTLSREDRERTYRRFRKFCRGKRQLKGTAQIRPEI